ncbi:Mov34/MPN/PAD-1 family protein [Pontixanthobacter sp.]|uniref:Mov34/MPN/PAD-1 family protein n=1 Tax=Pontixanthobacter sp. TaxID=2792078 RepID=UPI003C7DFC3C
MDVQIAQIALETVLSAAHGAGQAECCGLLLGRGNAVTRAEPARNVHPNPQTHFEIDPAALIAAHKAAREGGDALLGYYHSHPNGLARPSPTDAAMAAGDGTVWAIVTRTEVTFWRDTPHGFAPLSYSVTGE